MPRTTTIPDFYSSTASFTCEIDPSEESCVFKIETDEGFAKMLCDSIADDAAALLRAEHLAPRGEALERLLQQFPAPQEWWDEDE
jgi:hypothetical protein